MLRAARNFTRLIRIALILKRHGVLLFWRGEATPDKGRRLAAALHALGPSFIKFGQALSTRPDLVGQEVALALADLQDRLPPFPSATGARDYRGAAGKPGGRAFRLLRG